MKLMTVERGCRIVQYFLTLPKKLVEAKDWKKGQELKIKFNERENLGIED